MAIWEQKNRNISIGYNNRNKRPHTYFIVISYNYKKRVQDARLFRFNAYFTKVTQKYDILYSASIESIAIRGSHPVRDTKIALTFAGKRRSSKYTKCDEEVGRGDKIIALKKAVDQVKLFFFQVGQF